MGGELKSSQSSDKGRVSRFNYILHEKDEAAEVSKRKK